MTCDNCKKPSDDCVAVKERLPGRPANNGRSHAYGGKVKNWCGKCRTENRGRWKSAQK